MHVPIASIALKYRTYLIYANEKLVTLYLWRLLDMGDSIGGNQLLI